MRETYRQTERRADRVHHLVIVLARLYCNKMRALADTYENPDSPQFVNRYVPGSRTHLIESVVDTVEDEELPLLELFRNDHFLAPDSYAGP